MALSANLRHVATLPPQPWFAKHTATLWAKRKRQSGKSGGSHRMSRQPPYVVGVRILRSVSGIDSLNLQRAPIRKRHDESRGRPQDSGLEIDIGSRETVTVGEQLLHDGQRRRIGIFHSADDGVVIEGERRLELTGKPLHPLILR